jgi:hypothetical protein
MQEATEMIHSSRRCNLSVGIKTDRFKCAAAIFIALSIMLSGSLCLAADKASKYEVVPGTDDKAYLVDTSSGFVWVLTYRTLATGREPVAIPYKFIKISPKNQKDFLVESSQDASLPTCKTPY